MSTPIPVAATVVLVEDDEAVRESLCFSLESEGFKVMLCESGEALLAARLPLSPACVLLDQHLGDGMTGLEALRILRAQGVTLPAIAITTVVNYAIKRQARDLGAAVIEKPLLGDALFDAIGAAIAASGPGPQVGASTAATRAG